MLPNRIFQTFCLLVVLPLLFGCDDDSGGPVVTNCRIKEMHYDGPTNYTFKFDYNKDGTLNSITSPNVSTIYRYENGRVKTIFRKMADDVETLTYEYPTDKLITWTSSLFNEHTYRLYHTGDKADSMVVISTSSLQPPVKYYWYAKYIANNVETITFSHDCCQDYNIADIEYDNGLNPASLLRKSVGGFTGLETEGDELLRFIPDELSENNPTRYYAESTLIEADYTYPTNGSYPLTISKYSNGNLNAYTTSFVYENCD